MNLCSNIEHKCYKFKFFTNLKGNNNGNKTSEKCDMGKSTKEVDEQNDKQQHQCSICFREFESVLLLNEHYIVCEKTLQCKRCKEYSDTVMDFEKHKKKCKQIYCCDVCVQNCMWEN